MRRVVTRLSKETRNLTIIFCLVIVVLAGIAGVVVHAPQMARVYAGCLDRWEVTTADGNRVVAISLGMPCSNVLRCHTDAGPVDLDASVVRRIQRVPRPE